MRKFLAAFVLYLLASPAFAAGPLFGGAYDSDAQAYFNSLSANSCAAPSVAYQTAISNFIYAEKSAGNWGSQDYIYVIVTTDSCTASINLAQPNLYKATITNTCTLSVANGMQGNATDCYLDPNVTDTNLKRASQNNSHWLVCVGGAGATNSIGNTGGTTYQFLTTATNKGSRLFTSVTVTDTGGGGVGCHYADRTSSSTLTTGANGAVQSNAVASTSHAGSGTDVALCRLQSSYCAGGQKFYYYEFGSPINDEATHYTNIHTLLVALGAGSAP